MSIRMRLNLVGMALLAIFLIALLFLRHKEHDLVTATMDESRRSSRVEVQQWIDLTAQPLRRFAEDFSRWDELVKFMRKGDLAWAEANLHAVLPDYGASAAWLLDADGRLVYAARRSAGPPLRPPGDTVARAQAHYFADSRDGLQEVWCEPVVGAGTDEHPVGWFIVARLWNEPFLVHLGRLTETQLTLGPTGQLGLSASGVLSLRLKNQAGLYAWQLQWRLGPTQAAVLPWDDLKVAQLLILFAVLVITGTWLAVRRWIQRPLERVTTSLAQGDLAPLQPMLKEKDEFGRVARLVESSFAQHDALKREIEDRRRAEAALRASEEAVRHSLEVRARLARDLHDGVIQSIYAAGLGLECAVAELEHDKLGAQSRLQYCRQSLNDVIRQVRAFISGLEPETAPRRDFAGEMVTLAQTMQALLPARIKVEVDPIAASRMSPVQEVHALQIVRECISNALRHGNAATVTVTLASAESSAILTVLDDGLGFDPRHPAGKGSGLINIAARAREMDGTFTLKSKPGQGTVISVSLPVAPNSIREQSLLASSRAFTVVEVAIAATVLLFGIVSAIATIQHGFKALDTARNLNAASQVMQSEIERLRLLSWSQLQTLQDSGTTAVTTDTGAGAIGCRREIVDIKTDMKQIAVTATWSGFDGQTHTARLITRYGKSGLNDYFYTTH